MLENIHQMSMRILSEVGIRIDDENVLNLLRDNNVKLDRNIAFFTENQVNAALSTTPEAFTLQGRNKLCRPHIGGSSTQYLSGYGAPDFMDNGVRRKAVLQDYINMAKLVQSVECISINGGILVQPDDIQADIFQLILLYTTILFSDKALMGMTSNSEKQLQIIELLKIAFDGQELGEQPVMMTLVNTTSPLILDSSLLQTMSVCAAYRQPVVISPSPMAGMTGPLDIESNLALGNAEVLAAITCAQLISPGTPVVYGIMAHAADMQSGEIDPGSPFTIASTIICGKLAKRYGLPSRSGSSPNAKQVSVLSGLESMMINQAASNAELNVIVHAAGFLDRYNCMSPEQFLIDVEIIRRIEYFKAIFSKGALENMESDFYQDIKQAGIGGNFLMAMSTVKHCRTKPFVSNIIEKAEDMSVSENRRIVQDARNQFEQILEKYQAPAIDPEKHSKMRELLLKAGVSKETIDFIDDQYAQCRTLP